MTEIKSHTTSGTGWGVGRHDPGQSGGGGERERGRGVGAWRFAFGGVVVGCVGGGWVGVGGLLVLWAVMGVPVYLSLCVAGWWWRGVVYLVDMGT